MQPEKKVLGILAIVFGALALLGSWVPIINNLSFVIAIVGLVLGGVGLYINRQNTKVLAIVGTALSVGSILIVIGTQMIYGQAIKTAGEVTKTVIEASSEIEEAASSASSELKEVTSSASSAVEEITEGEFKWTKASFDALTVGDTLSGAGGESYDSVIKQFGKPESESESTIGDVSNKLVTYTTFNSGFKSVSLSFSKQPDGQFLLSSKSATGLE